MLLASPPLAGLLRQAESLWVLNSIFFVQLQRKSPREFGRVAVFRRNEPETGFDCTEWPSLVTASLSQSET